MTAWSKCGACLMQARGLVLAVVEVQVLLGSHLHQQGGQPVCGVKHEVCQGRAAVQVIQVPPSSNSSSSVPVCGASQEAAPSPPPATVALSMGAVQVAHSWVGGREGRGLHHPPPTTQQLTPALQPGARRVGPSPVQQGAGGQQEEGVMA
jgi:hypothetical protein